MKTIFKIGTIIFGITLIISILMALFYPYKDLKLETNPNISNGITDKEKISFLGTTKNIKVLKINGKIIPLNGGKFEYSINLDMGENKLLFLGDDEILVNDSITRLNKSEYIKQQEKIKKEKKQKEKINAENKKEAEMKEKYGDNYLCMKRINKEEICEQISGYDGSYKPLVKYIKDNMNNPDSFEHIKTLFSGTKDEAIFVMQYYGKNVFNTKVKESVKIKINLDSMKSTFIK